MPSWNGLLAMGHGLAVRAGWTGQEHTASWTLAARPSAVHTARRMTAARLTAWQLTRPLEVARLLVGELVADALRRGAGRIRLTLSAEDGLLRCEVDEQEPAKEAPGREQPLLERTACCWGTAGAVVWFELRIEPEAL